MLSDIVLILNRNFKHDIKLDPISLTLLKVHFNTTFSNRAVTSAVRIPIKAS